MSAKICQEEVYGSIFHHTEIVNPSNIHTEICHLLVALCNDHDYTCEYIYERHSLHLLGCIFYWCLRERIGTEVPGKGMRTAFTGGPLSVKSFYENVTLSHPFTSAWRVTSCLFFRWGDSDAVTLRALPEATQLVNGRAGLWRGRSGLSTASGLGLPVLVPRSPSRLLRKELLSSHLAGEKTEFQSRTPLLRSAILSSCKLVKVSWISRQDGPSESRQWTWGLAGLPSAPSSFITLSLESRQADSGENARRTWKG